MFGYIKPEKNELKLRELSEFRAFYCGVCTSLQNARYFAKFFLSYDSVFFALLLTSLKGKTLQYRKRFCGFTLKNVSYYESEEISLAASNFLMLIKYKLLDDVKDDKNIIKYFILKFFDIISSGSKEVEVKLQRLLNELEDSERLRVSSIRTTADIFGNIVALFFENVNVFSNDQRVVLTHLAKHTGVWIYILDAFDDLRKDVKNGNYNPLLLQYGYKDDTDLDDFIDRIRPEVRKYLFESLDEIVLSYNLLDVKTYKGILDNIVYLGLFEETERILNGKKTCRKA